MGKYDDDDDDDDKTQVKKSDFEHFAVLLALSGKGNIKTGVFYNIDKPIIKIGRNEKTDIKIDLPNISKIHSVITYDRKINDFILEPYSDESEGTFLNGNEVIVGNPKILKDNDFVRFGDIEMLFKKVW